MEGVYRRRRSSLQDFTILTFDNEIIVNIVHVHALSSSDDFCGYYALSKQEHTDKSCKLYKFNYNMVYFKKEQAIIL